MKTRSMKCRSMKCLLMKCRSMKYSLMRCLSFLPLACAAMLAACHGGDHAAGPAPGIAPTVAPAIAHTAAGDVVAVDRAGMRSYFAIPFAAPPVGELRWAAPAPPRAWTAPLAKTGSAAPCLQTSESPFRLAGDSEDCLYLDVHAPVGQGPFPVMVNLHGGAFNTGGPVAYTDPSPLVTKGVIVVNVAYRLGAMGFLAHPALAAGGGAGNYGIMDQQAALTWVRDNIAHFAGDRNNVTLFGESAGGFSVMAHLAAPGSRDLFHKAIVQSGNYGNDRQLTAAQMASASAAIVDDALRAARAAGVQGIGCSPGAVTAACLRALPEPVVRSYLAQAIYAALPVMVPSVDGRVLPKSVKATFAAGENLKVPLINGSNRDEYTLYIAIAEAARRAAAAPPDLDPTDTRFALPAAAYAPTVAGLTAGAGVPAADLVARWYPLAAYGSNAALQPSLAVSALGTDLGFACPALRVTQRVAAQKSPAWMYEFRDRTATPLVGVAQGKYYLSFPQGAGHSYDFQYLYELGPLANDEQRQLQAAMTRYWTNFARSGDPNRGADVPAAWPPFTGPDRVLGLDVASGGGIKPLATFEADHGCAEPWGAVTF